jgi:hypothetical protein
LADLFSVLAEELLLWPAEAEQAERRAPTRPHPHLPPDPRLLRAVAPAAARLDRARNAVTRHL